MIHGNAIHEGAISRLRVLHVLRPAAGGMRRHVSELCRELPAHGVFCMVAGPRVSLAELSPDTPRMDLGMFGVSPLLEIPACVRLARAARSFDLLHGHGLRGAFAASIAGALSGRRVVVTVHNMPNTGSRTAALYTRVALARSNGIIAVSRAVAEAVRQRAPARVPLEVIPNGVRLPDWTAKDLRGPARLRLAIGEAEPLVLAVGRLEPEKGFDVLLHAAAEPAWPQEAKVCIVGDGSRREELERLMEEYGLRTRVQFMGYQRKLDDWYAAADLVVVPSRSEGQGLAALEAMACGLPVIATCVGGLPEVVSHDVTGILVPSADPRALAAAVASLLGDPERRQRYGAQARYRVETEFRLEAVAEKTSAFYRHVREGPAAGQAADPPYVEN